MRNFLIVCSVIGLLGAPAQSQQLQVRLPPAVLEAADAGALPLAFALATRGVPAGVVTTEDPSAIAPIRIDPAAAATATLDEVIARLRAKHPDYAVGVKDGVLGLEQSGTECGRAVDSIRLKANTLQADAPRSLIVLSWLASGEPPPVPAIHVTTFGGRVGESLPPLPPIDLVIAEGMTLRAAFDDVVRRNKGGVWIAWQHTRDDRSTGCLSVGYYSNGQAGASTKDFAIVKP